MIHFYFHTKMCEIKTEYVHLRRLCHYSLTLPAILKLFFPDSICYSTGICKPHLPSWLFSGCVRFFPSLYNMEITMLIHLVNCAVIIYPFPSAQYRDVFGFPSDFFCSHCHCDSPVYTWNYSVQGTWLLQSSPHSGLHKALTIPIVISVILSSHIMCASWFIRPPPGNLCMVVSVTIEIYTLFCLMQVAGVSLQRVGARQPGQWRERR